MRNHFGRHARHRSPSRDIRHDHSPGTYRSALTDMHTFDDTHRRTNIDLIFYDRTMEIQTTNRGEVSEVLILDNVQQFIKFRFGRITILIAYFPFGSPY